MEDNFIDEQAKIVWDYMLMHHEIKPMDAIFALGSNDIRVAERAAELYLQGYGQYVICAGGNGKASDFTKPEAEVFRDVIIAKGVPADKIIIEPNSTNTGDNVLFVKKLLAEKGYNFKSFILVQKPYMERRTFATFKKQWSEPECVVTSPNISYEEYSKDEEFKKRFINVMVGDLIRIKEYPKLGFQIEQNVPENVWGACKKLIDLGFNKYIL
jgi:uncharacterized SAM-binding protein YcdF (DUF218 family)